MSVCVTNFCYLNFSSNTTFFKILTFSKFQCTMLRKYFSTCQDVFLAQCLKERTLLQLSGNEAKIYLQGLITNDMSHLQGGISSMFTMFLNSKGRILYDSIIYKTEKENSFFIECDKNASSTLKDHLLRYKVRRKVDINFLENELDIWAVVHNKSFENATYVYNYKKVLNLIQQNLVNITSSSDPRLPCLGLRIVTPKSFNLSKEFEEKIDIKVQEENFYKLHRYKLGIGEGLEELQFEKCFPMEANGDYLNGISFQKGCYIGQELTARTYHTGIIRKRFMPLLFEEETKTTEYGIPIFPVPQTSKPIGKLQGVEKINGLGILRIEEALKADELMVLGVKCKTHRPFWWPTEVPKEMLKIA